MIGNFDPKVKSILEDAVIKKSGKMAVYTAIFGENDCLNEILEKNDDIDYYCFTDNPKLTSKTWSVIHCCGFYSTSRLTAKVFKILPHHVFVNYDYSIWIDGSYRIKSNLVELCNIFFKNKRNILFFSNPFRDCLYKEAKVCSALGLDDKEVIDRQIKKYVFNNYPANNGLIHGALIIRKHHNEIVNKVMDLWWNEVSNYSYRDQISFNYIAWEEGLNVGYIKGALSSSEDFEFTGHIKMANIGIFRKIWIRLKVMIIDNFQGDNFER